MRDNNNNKAVEQEHETPEDLESNEKEQERNPQIVRENEK